MKPYILWTLFSAICAIAQTPAPAFEVASVRPSLPGSGRRDSGSLRINSSPGNLVMQNARLTEYVKWAYRVQDFQISGPAWLGQMQFDLTAKAATPVTEAELRVMLQTLLAERFKLQLRRETRELPVLVIKVTKNGHKLKEAPAGETPSFRTGKFALTAQNATLGQMAEFLSRELRTLVLDQTGLTGNYNYAVDINTFLTDEMRQALREGPPLEAPAIVSQALQEQLGLRIEASKAPVTMLIIDHMEREPSEN